MKIWRIGLMEIFFNFFRSIPSTQPPAYNWPSSPILPPVSSRTPHLVPELMPPATSAQLALTNEPSHHNSSAAQNQSFNHRSGSWIELNFDDDDQLNNNNDTHYLETHFTIDNHSYTSVSRRNSKFTKQREKAARSLDKY